VRGKGVGIVSVKLYPNFFRFVCMFALTLGIGHSGGLSPEYPKFNCLAGLCIEAMHPASISSPDPNERKGEEQMSRGIR
jgi:hypothetical protein